MSARAKIVAAVGILLIFCLGGILVDYFDPASPAHAAMQYQLKAVGAAIYEFHSATGRWPASLDDLTETSLNQRSPIWRKAAETFTFLWPKDLNGDPKANGNVLLVYDHAGLFNNLGRVWVCWGDLRTEHIRERELSAYRSNKY